MGEIAIEPDCLIEISNGAVLIALVPIWEAPFVVDGPILFDEQFHPRA